MTFSLYLSPEPMLQEPNWVKHEAAAGFTTPTYAYARNNPLRYTDPTGLFSWRRACAPSTLHGGDRGFVATLDDVFGPRIIKHSGSVGFDNPNSTACEDLAWMRNWQRVAPKKLAPSDYDAFGEASDCWDALQAEVEEACKRERRREPAQCDVPPDPSPNPTPRPPLGG